MEYQDQHAEALRLYLAGGQLDPQQFNRLAIAEKRIGPFSVYATIIGASHHIAVTHGDDTINEVLACVQASGGSVLADVSIQKPPKALNLPEIRFGSIGYNTLISWVEFSQAARWVNNTEDRVIAAADQEGMIGLRYDFPCPQGEKHIPKTLVLIEPVDEGTISINTIHSYPQDGVIVVTATEITNYVMATARV